VLENNSTNHVCVDRRRTSNYTTHLKDTFEGKEEVELGKGQG